MLFRSLNSGLLTGCALLQVQQHFIQLRLGSSWCQSDDFAEEYGIDALPCGEISRVLWTRDNVAQQLDSSIAGFSDSAANPGCLIIGRLVTPLKDSTNPVRE